MKKLMENYIEVHSLEVKQRLLLELMRRFHTLCEENHLVYNIFGGTMLGAVRHGGFIPWDDDIDVTMPRPDYEKMVALVREKYSDSLTLHAYPDKNYIYPYAKIGMKGTVLRESYVKRRYNQLSLNIDVFPNDGYPGDTSVLKKYEALERAIILCTYRNQIVGSIPRRVWRIAKRSVFAVIGVDHLVKRQIDLLSKYPLDGNEYMLCQGAGWGEKGKLKKDLYYERRLYDFDGIQVWGIRDYHDHLTMLYGNYMELPPEEKRIGSHDSELYVDKDLYDCIINGKG